MGLVVEHNLKPRKNKIQCNECIHFHRHTGNCDAFSAGIPKEIILGKHDHRFSYPGDNGILFESTVNIIPATKPDKAFTAHH